MRIRPAQPADVPALRALAERAYAPYVPRIGRRPAPMDEDYAAEVAAGSVHVIEEEGGPAGLVVLVAARGHLLVQNVAVAPERQGRGLGRALLDFAEEEARRRGLGELRLYTNAAMRENVRLYRRLGYVETGRRSEGGFERVFLRKPLDAGAAGGS